MTQEKVLDCTSGEDVKAKVPDVKFFGSPDTFQLISKASSVEGGWLKSTKAMEIPGSGCVVQVSTQQKNIDGSYSLAEAITFVPFTRIRTIYGGVPEGVTEFNAGDYPIIGRELVPDQSLFMTGVSELKGCCCGPEDGCASGVGSGDAQKQEESA